MQHVIVNKTVPLIGKNRNTTIIDGNETGTVVKVTADNVSGVCEALNRIMKVLNTYITDLHNRFA